MLYQKVEIDWFDAQHSTVSMYVDELEKLEPLFTKSIGYLVVNKSDYVILGFVNFGKGLFKHYQLIPRGMIKKIKELIYKKQ